MSPERDDSPDGLIRLLPRIRRARLWRLYAEDGRRFLDLGAGGGAGILGAKGTGLGRVVKSCIDMGLAGPMPSAWEGRFLRALAAWRPGYKAARLFRSTERAIAAAGARGPLPVERPFGEYLVPTPVAADLALALLPCPAMLAPAVLLFKEPADAAGIEPDVVPPLALATAARSLSELAAFRSTYGEPLWKKTDRRTGGCFRRSGPWLYPLHGPERHADFFRACLDRGIVVSPDYAVPSLVPGDFDDGELKPLESMVF